MQIEILQVPCTTAVATVARKENIYFFCEDRLPIEFVSYLDTLEAHLIPGALLL